jgi:phage-related baseplate assembly protein
LLLSQLLLSRQIQRPPSTAVTAAAAVEGPTEAAVEGSTLEVAEGPTEAVAGFTEAVVEGSTLAVVEGSRVAAEGIVEAAPMEARGLSEEEVLTEAEAFVADRRRVTTERTEVRTADSVHRAA